MSSDELNDIRADLKKIIEVTKHNEAMLESVQRRARLALFGQALKWLIIIGISIGAFIYVQPILEQLLETYKSISNFGGDSKFFDFFK
jgi:hypothetical protein